ncbi:histone-lysine N-methyltransferase SETMAR [Trichonephila clavipes]|nr:histone-lysine N-methyltransferase SETMAR [Trichonephila clavipes]
MSASFSNPLIPPISRSRHIVTGNEIWVHYTQHWKRKNNFFSGNIQDKQSHESSNKHWLPAKSASQHQDNTRPNTAHLTTNLINRFGWGTVRYPPYCPDIVQNDYHLLPKLKKHLDVMHFKTREELKEEALSYSRVTA